MSDIDWVLVQMEKDGGWLRFPPEVVQILTQLKIANYAENYVDEKRIWALFAMTLAGEGSGLQEFLKGIEKEYRDDPNVYR
jgi:hypothetical protein